MARTRSTERGVFGGPAAGLWLVRQKHKSNRQHQNKWPTIQWDEEKCRPIYEHRFSTSMETQSTENDDANIDENESIFNDSPFSRTTFNANNKRQPSRRGVFGLRKKTPRFVVTTTTNAQSSSDNNHNQDSTEISNSNPNQAIVETSKVKNGRKIIRQPCHISALSVAREFFNKLDQTTLTIETDADFSCKDQALDQSKQIQTRRGKLPSAVVRTEYRKYKEACRCANIRPLSQHEFLQQRSQFFRPGEIFDGMFDD